jgi:hypothetical protein
MNMKNKIFLMYISILLAELFLPLRVSGNIVSPEQAEYEKKASVLIKTMKTVFEPNEPIPLIVAIANHTSEPIYIYRTLSDFYETSCYVSDSNGKGILGAHLSEEKPPLDYYIEKNGNPLLVLPFYKIDGYGVMIAIIADAIKLYHKNMTEGTYNVGPILTETLHDVNDIIERDNYPVRLWISPMTRQTRVLRKSNSVKIEIRKKPELQKETKSQQPLAESQPFVWPTFLVGAAVGFCAFGLILLVMKKTKLKKA